jgi:predicted O-methyltransferase YrrM
LTIEGYTSHNTVDWLHYLTHAEVDELQRLAQSLPEPLPIAVQIGAGGGTGGLALMQSRDDLLLYTIDIQDISSPYGCLEGERLELEKAGFANSPRYKQIHGDSKEVGKKWIAVYQYGLVDMCFIDGDHSVEGAKGDINIWRPLIKHGGIMSIHDYAKTEKVWPGVDTAVRKLLLRKYELISQVDTLISFRMP